MTLTARNAALAMVALVFSSCSAADQPAWCSEARAIVNGAAGPPPELGEAAFTVVGLRVRHGAGEQAFDEICSGVRLDDRRIVTAAHCFSDDPRQEITLSTDAVLPEGRDCTSSAAPAAADPVAWGLHPQRDVAVVTTPRTSAVATPACSSLPAPGAAGFVAGYGLDENGAVGARRFLSTRVVNVTDDAIEVRALIEAGACLGDSGGPLFIEQDGTWCVVGTLSTGSASCRAFDRYVPLLPLADWLQGF